MQLRLFLLFVLFSVAICNPAKKEGKVDEKESSEEKSKESIESSDTKSTEEAHCHMMGQEAAYNKTEF